jgi:uncharacterized membrane protein YjjP (DUF1212 family)
MENIDYILDFTVHLGREMLKSGANLERVERSIELICKTYKLREVSISLMSSSITVSAREKGKPAKVRQVKVPSFEIHLERLRKLNDLSYRVCSEKPQPIRLEDMLYEAAMTRSYSSKMLLFGYVLAMSCLCRIFEGGIRDIIVADISTVIIFLVTSRLAREHLNRIITNVISMFLACSIALFFTYIGFAKNFYAIIITNAFYLIPGVPMVNAVRNILCGNEMNGIIELIKVFLEVITIVIGLNLAIFFFGQWYTVG